MVYLLSFIAASTMLSLGSSFTATSTSIRITSAHAYAHAHAHGNAPLTTPSVLSTSLSSASTSYRIQIYQQNHRRRRQSSSTKTSLQMINNKNNSNKSFNNPVDDDNTPRVTVMGGGNFGLALATVVARKNIPTTLLIRSEATAQIINDTHRHPRYMEGIDLPELIQATSDAKSALADATYVIHAVPCQYSREFLLSENVIDLIDPTVPVLSASKGIETTSLGFMADILKDCLGTERSYAFLSGPSFAREICENVATAVVIASEDLMLADDLADLMSDDNFRVFTSKDVVGVEIGGAVKNVIALAAGMCEGLGLGTNAMSGLVTRGCAEMRRLGLTLGARPSTIAGLSGVGDTFGTCFGPLSRNRKFGYRLGQGETMEEILASTTEVAEGVETSKALVKMIKKKCKGYRLDLKFPILFGVADILEGRQTPEEGLKGLMSMPMRMESFDERGYYTVTRQD